MWSVITELIDDITVLPSLGRPVSGHSIRGPVTSGFKFFAVLSMSIFLIQLKQTPHKLSFYKIKWISRWLWCFSVYLEYWEKILDFFFTLMSYRQHYCTFSWWKEKYWWYVPSCSLNNNPCKICSINCNWLSIFLWWNYLNFFKGEERGVRCYIKDNKIFSIANS